MKVKIKKYKEIILYVFFGVLTTAVNWLFYALLVKLLKVNVSKGDVVVSVSDFLLKITNKEYTKLLLCNIVAWTAAVIFAFITNKLFVFESKQWNFKLLSKEAAAFFGTRVLTGVLESLGHPLLIALGLDYKLFGVEGFWAKVILSVAVVVLNYIFSKLIVFKHKQK